MLGAHGKREKGNFYEESSCVPLFMTYDGVIEPNTTVDTMVGHLDVFATILDYLGQVKHDNSDGSSLRPSIEQTSYNEHYDEDVVVSEWDFRQQLVDGKLSSRIDERPALMIRKGDWKLMTHRLANSEKLDMMYNLKL